MEDPATSEVTMKPFVVRHIILMRQKHQVNPAQVPEFRFRIGSNPLGRLWGDIF
jgi:hypothetical protein